MAAAGVGQNADHADDHGRDQDDEADNYDHDVLRESELQISVEEGSPEFSPCLSRGVSPPPTRVRIKLRNLPLSPRVSRGRSCRGPEQHSYTTRPLDSQVKGCF